MSAERPTGAPLHGKRTYAYVGQSNSAQGAGLEFVSFAKEFSVNLTPQNTARAVVMGSDAVPDVEIHGIVARVRLGLLLTSKESDILLALASVAANADNLQDDVDYNDAVIKLIGRQGFTNAARLDVIIAPLEETPADPTAALPADLDTIRTSAGYTIELTAAAIVGLEITGRVGEYAEARLEVETGRFKINARAP